MPTLHVFPASRAVMHACDHPPAHVHIQLRDGRICTVELDSLAIVGRIMAREIREELQWIASNRTRLYVEWQRLNP
ncbi:MAG: DUF4160 domain-containing protein [Betaproteobacteria bacterium]|nr:DUF4160 domain-containing protein [Betaproteobacteria bacterium]